MATYYPAALNNRAIGLWQAGRPKEAMHTFHAALTTLRIACEVSASVGPIQQNDPSSSPLPGDTLSVSRHCHGDKIEMPRDFSALTCYDRALLFDSANPRVDEVLLHAGIIFNMALLHHSNGMEEASDLSLEKANQLYLLAYTLVLHEKAAITQVRFCLVLFNNLAHIASQLRLVNEMVDTLETMSGVLLSAVDGQDVSINAQDYLIFRANILNGRAIRFMSAPAA